MALTTTQQAEMDKLKQFLTEQDLVIRQSYQGMFATNGSFFFNLFKELEKKIESVENAQVVIGMDDFLLDAQALQQVRNGQIRNGSVTPDKLDLRTRSFVLTTLKSPQSLNRNILTKVIYNGETIDNQKEFELTSSLVRVKTTGIYELKLVVGFEEQIDRNLIQVFCHINGVYARTLASEFISGKNSSLLQLTGYAFLDLKVGDEVDIYVMTDKSITIAAGKQSTRLALIKHIQEETR